MKITGDTTCPNCNKEHPVSVDIDKLEVKGNIPSMFNATASPSLQTSTIQLEKPVEKEVIKTILPEHIPAYKCTGSNCGEIHKNKNYHKKPKGKCTNCGQFAKDADGECPWCREKDAIEELGEDDLSDLGIPNPPEVEHEHE